MRKAIAVLVICTASIMGAYQVVVAGCNSGEPFVGQYSVAEITSSTGTIEDATGGLE